LIPFLYPEETMQNDHIRFSAKVQEAMRQNLPVVALESTVLTHGLPLPQNLEVFRHLEQALEEEGAVAATIIVLDGIAHIGLNSEAVDDIESRLRNPGSFDKLGMRDLPYAMAKGLSGGTTVSATMKLAQAAGIEVFATGGIGGVHRGWERTLDISSDLKALAEIPVAVVSAGCKAILDVPATLEYLETLAVPVLGWQTNLFPLFYTAESSHTIDRLDSEDEFASLWKQHRSLGGGGILVANPIPTEHSIPAEQMDGYIRTAITEAKIYGKAGKALTPFLLDYLAQVTKGGSVKANLALLENNARLAARLAKALKIKGDV
jgi:pseudouridine-5'-phosphate glycosidase